MNGETGRAPEPELDGELAPTFTETSSVEIVAPPEAPAPAPAFSLIDVDPENQPNGPVCSNFCVT